MSKVHLLVSLYRRADIAEFIVTINYGEMLYAAAQIVVKNLKVNNPSLIIVARYDDIESMPFLPLVDENTSVLEK